MFASGVALAWLLFWPSGCEGSKSSLLKSGAQVKSEVFNGGVQEDRLAGTVSTILNSLLSVRFVTSNKGIISLIWLISTLVVVGGGGGLTKDK